MARIVTLLLHDPALTPGKNTSFCGSRSVMSARQCQCQE